MFSFNFYKDKFQDLNKSILGFFWYRDRGVLIVVLFPVNNCKRFSIVQVHLKEIAAKALISLDGYQ